MADEPKLKTTSKKESHQERLPWLKKFVGVKRRQPILSITQPLPPSSNADNSTSVLDQDSPFYLIKQLSTWIDRGFNVTAIMDNLLRGLIRTLHLDHAAYFVINPLEESAQLKMQFTASGLKAIVATGYSVPLINDSILGWVFNQKHEHVLLNILGISFHSFRLAASYNHQPGHFPIICQQPSDWILGFPGPSIGSI